jgi:hypothetical protein
MIASHNKYEREREGEKVRKKESEKNAYSIFGISKQVSILFLSSMFVYSS